MGDIPMTTVPAPTTSASYRELGVGTAVIRIHSSAGSSAQWRALLERLADRFRVVAVDVYGAGKTDPWPGDRPMRLGVGHMAPVTDPEQVNAAIERFLVTIA